MVQEWGFPAGGGIKENKMDMGMGMGIFWISLRGVNGALSRWIERVM